MSTLVQQAYQQTRRLVGVTTVKQLGVVRRTDLDRFAIAVGLSPGTEQPRVAHPLYLTAVLGWAAGPPNADLRPDGTEVLDTDAIPLRGLRLMGGGQDLDFHRDVTEGMRVHAEMTLEDVEVKQGRSGDLLVLRLVRRYLDEAGALLLTCRETLLAR